MLTESTTFSTFNVQETWKVQLLLSDGRGAARSSLRQGAPHLVTPLDPVYRPANGLPRWLSGLRHSAHRPERSAGGAGFNPRVGR